ncbi:MAG TPA: hypothetical protein VMZ50_10420 [Phycisphaerae bacterium]|nr:hypothetical protein [Phycisphaerae bacterium]
MTKRRLLLLVAGALAGTSFALAARGIDPIASVGGSILVLFLACVLVDGPKKHKDFTYADQLKGMLQSYGGNPPPELAPPEDIPEEPGGSARR